MEQNKSNVCTGLSGESGPMIRKFYRRAQDDWNGGGRSEIPGLSFSQPRQIPPPDATNDPIRHEKRLRPAAHLLAEVNGSPGVHGPL